jgi:4-amino-4-deoxy-L-arabinose transferase-like glycosyltransferase
MNEWILKRVNIIIIIFIVIFTILVAVQSDKKFVLDEIDFPIVSHATSETGLPIYYRGQDNPRHLGIYHPPLYIYSLAGFVKIFGFNEISVRFFGLICVLLTVYILVLLIKKLFPLEDRQSLISIIFVSLFLSHPYTIANTTLPDIDQTILPLTLSLYLYFIVNLVMNQSLIGYDKKFKYRDAIIILSLIFCLNLWAKLTTPLALIPATFFILIAARVSFFKAIKTTIFISILGMGIFLVTYAAYCFYANLPLSYTFNFLLHSSTKSSVGLLHSFTKGSVGSNILINKFFLNIYYIKSFSLWLTIPFIFLYFTSLFYLTFKRNKNISERIALVISYFGLFVSIFYLCLTGPFGGFFKYVFPVFFTFFIPISYFFYNTLFSELKPIKVGSANNLILIFVLIFLLVFLYRIFISKDNSYLTKETVNGLILFGALMTSFIFSIQIHRRNIFVIRLVICALMACVFGNLLGISRSQAVAPYPTKYHYGQLGMTDTILYLKANVMPNEAIWSMKDVGFYVNNIYYENYGDIFSSDLKPKLRKLVKDNHVRYFVVTHGIGQDRYDAYPVLQDGLNDCCKLDKQFGNFLIYKAKKR